jgi:ADP-heptose:LPS heptosyltransferase
MRRRVVFNDALFISMGGIGNLVLLTPALQAFEALYPQARLHFMLPDNGARQVVECHPRIGAIVETVASNWSLPLLINKLLRIRPDIVVAANGTNPLKCGIIGLLCRAPLRLGESFKAGKLLYNITVPFDPMLHESAANMRLIQRLSLETESPGPMVWTTEDDRSAAKEFIAANGLDRRWVGLHLGSGPAMSYKRWPTERFIEVSRALVDRFACRIVIFGGPDEALMAKDASEKIGKAATIAAGKLTIRQSFEVMKRSALFISNDSGPMHLAAAAGAPVIALFGPTLDNKTSPLGSRSMVLTAPVACRPCYKYKPIECQTMECLNNISVNQVVEAAVKVLTSP